MEPTSARISARILGISAEFLQGDPFDGCEDLAQECMDEWMEDFARLRCSSLRREGSLDTLKKSSSVEGFSSRHLGLRQTGLSCPSPTASTRSGSIMQWAESSCSSTPSHESSGLRLFEFGLASARLSRSSCTSVSEVGGSGMDTPASLSERPSHSGSLRRSSTGTNLGHTPGSTMLPITPMVSPLPQRRSSLCEECSSPEKTLEGIFPRQPQTARGSGRPSNHNSEELRQNIQGHFLQSALGPVTSRP